MANSTVKAKVITFRVTDADAKPKTEIPRQAAEVEGEGAADTIGKKPKLPEPKPEWNEFFRKDAQGRPKFKATQPQEFSLSAAAGPKKTGVESFLELTFLSSDKIRTAKQGRKSKPYMMSLILKPLESPNKQGPTIHAFVLSRLNKAFRDSVTQYYHISMKSAKKNPAKDASAFNAQLNSLLHENNEKCRFLEMMKTMDLRKYKGERSHSNG